MLGMDAVVVVVAVIDLCVEVDAAVMAAHAEGRPELAVDVPGVVSADAGLDLARWAREEGPMVALGRLGHEIQETADLARSVDRGGGATHHVDPRGVPQRGGVGPQVLDQLEALEVVLRISPADVERAGHAIEAGGEGARGDLDQIVDGLDAVALDRGVADQRRRAGGVQQGLVEAQDSVVRLPLEQADLVRGDHHFRHGGGSCGRWRLRHRLSG